MTTEPGHRAPTAYSQLEAYGIIGDLETVALVGRDGGIDWWCLPRLDSPSVFARLLDSQQGGHCTIAPADSFEATQRYVDRTNVLETQFRTAGGTAKLTDFMPVPATTDREQPVIYRRVTGEAGSVDLAVAFEPRFDYAETVPTIEPALTSHGVTAVGDDERLHLTGSVPFERASESATASLRLEAGETRWFVLGYDQSVRIDPDTHQQQLDDVIDYWQSWSHDCAGDPACPIEGPWHDLAVRSDLVLKLLIQRTMGTIAAAPTTSLPEAIGGSRNWDYRYNWIRDAAFTAQALGELGHREEIRAYFDRCLTHCSQGTPAEMQPVYGLHGATDITERTLDHLDGYRGSTPVRVGNRAADQRQLDVYGELLAGSYEAVGYGIDLLSDHWDLIRDIANHVCTVWQEPDVGIWELRGEPEQFVYSKVMCWAALDRAAAFVQETNADTTTVEGPVDRWRETRETIRRTVLDRGYNEEIGSFVRSFEADDQLDAALLRLPEVGFLPADDPRIEGTIDAVRSRLLTDGGLVHRLEGDDGLPGTDGAFVVCSFWLVNALAAAGRIEEATAIFERVCQTASPLGLLAEELDPGTGRQLGNFPQAFSHIGVLTSAMALRRQAGPQSATGAAACPPHSPAEQAATVYPGLGDPADGDTQSHDSDP